MNPENAKAAAEVIAAMWEGEFAATCQVLAAVKDDNRDYKPDAKSRTAWQLATHIATRADLVKRSNNLFNVVKSKKVKIETTARYKLADAAQAHRDLEARKTTGSVILIP